MRKFIAVLLMGVLTSSCAESLTQGTRETDEKQQIDLVTALHR
jgi:hypothetical protein